VCAPGTVAVQIAAAQEPSGLIENVAATLLSELFAESNPSAVYACDPPAEMIAVEGDTTIWSSGPTLTVNAAVSVLPPDDPVTVCGPGNAAVQLPAPQEPFGLIENVAPTLPSELPDESNPAAVYACEPPATIVALPGETTIWSRAPAVTPNEAVSDLPLDDPVTVCPPAVVAVQLAPPQEPFGVIEKSVDPVTSPSEFPEESNPSAVYACESPAEMVALPGDTTIWSRGPAVTFNVAVSDWPSYAAVTVCAPGAVAEQLAPEHEPPAIENVADDVTSPIEVTGSLKPSTVKSCDEPAGIDGDEGLITM